MPAGKIQVFIFSDQFLRLITYNSLYYTGIFMPTVMPAGNSACGYGSPLSIRLDKAIITIKLIFMYSHICRRNRLYEIIT
jgi:hypothetical protein